MSDPFGPSSSVANSVTTRPSDTRTFGAADTFLQDCVDGAGGTPITAEELNEIIANLRALLRGNGNLIAGAPVVSEDHTDGMLLRGVQQMIQRGQFSFAIDAGSADALVLNPTPAWLEYKPGATIWVVKGANPNATTTPTANISGLGATTILRSDGSAIQVGDMAGDGMFKLVVDPNQKLRLGSVLAAPKALAFWDANGTYTWTCPAGVNSVKATVVGAGGGGAGCASGTAGGCGGAGGAAIGRVAVIPGQAYAIIVGKGGLGGASGNNSGGNGGVSSALGLSATGGFSGNNTGANGGGGGPGVGSGGALNLSGGMGSDCMAGVNIFSGLGGASLLGGGGRAAYGPSSPALQNAVAPGSGGGSCYLVAGAGGSGADGAVLLEW
jgi:hypothetical protein